MSTKMVSHSVLQSRY